VGSFSALMLMVWQSACKNLHWLSAAVLLPSNLENTRNKGHL